MGEVISRLSALFVSRMNETEADTSSKATILTFIYNTYTRKRPPPLPMLRCMTCLSTTSLFDLNVINKTMCAI